MDAKSRAIVLERVTTGLESSSHGIDTQTFELLFAAVADALDDIDRLYDEFTDLSNLTYEKRNYERADELEGFDIGACWSCAKVLETVQRIRGEEGFRRECLQKAKRHSGLLEVISQNPGITQGSLAKMMGYSPSSLSQKLGRLMPYRLVSATTSGRSRHYRLTPFGKDVMRELENDAVAALSEPRRSDNGETAYTIGAAEGTLERNEGKRAYERHVSERRDDLSIVDDPKDGMGGKRRRADRPRTRLKGTWVDKSSMDNDLDKVV